MASSPSGRAGVSDGATSLSMRRFWQSMARDIRAARERDPAARSDLEVILCYPGFHALQLHRLAHRIHGSGGSLSARLIARLLSHLNRALTGIEIHPAARLGEGLFIDHGMGVVIGETTEVGDDVTLYQGVTLGGTSRLRGKRHPTLCDGVIVGAHAQLIGAVEIGEGVRVGAGVCGSDGVRVGTGVRAGPVVEAGNWV